MKRIFLLAVGLVCFFTKDSIAQVNQGQVGAWYMYFVNTTFKKSPWGIQGDVQYRNWNAIGDLEQLLLRGGLTYKPKNEAIKFTLGYANITTGAMGASNVVVSEHRIYQEALFSVKFGSRFVTAHRFRFEQRFVENQEFRTRYRYNLFLNIPLNKKVIEKNTAYLALYNELFINAQRSIGNGRVVEIFDRNRAYIAIGYCIQKGLKVQAGFMNQITNSWTKSQLQVSAHQTF